MDCPPWRKRSDTLKGETGWMLAAGAAKLELTIPLRCVFNFLLSEIGWKFWPNMALGGLFAIFHRLGLYCKFPIYCNCLTAAILACCLVICGSACIYVSRDFVDQIVVLQNIGVFLQFSPSDAIGISNSWNSWCSLFCSWNMTCDAVGLKRNFHSNLHSGP